MKRSSLLAVLALLTAGLLPGCLGLLPGSEEEPQNDPASGIVDADGDGIEDAFDPDGGTGEIPSEVTPPTPGDDEDEDDEPPTPPTPPSVPVPVASFRILDGTDGTTEVNRGFKNTFIKLDGTTTTDSTGTALSFEWVIREEDKVTQNFTGPTVERLTFEDAGVKVIELTVTNGKGGEAKLTQRYYRDLEVKDSGSHTWGEGRVVIQMETHDAFKNFTVARDGRNGFLELTWTTAQTARVQILSPSGNPVLDFTGEGTNVTIPIADAASFAEAGKYTTQITFTYDPNATGAPVAVGADGDIETSYNLRLAVYYGEAKA